MPQSSFMPGTGHLQDHVGALVAKDAAPAAVSGAFALGWGGLSYALLAGKWIVKRSHPILGVLTGIFALSAAGSTIYHLAAPTEKTATAGA